MRRHGIILLDESEIIFRIYETTDHEWKLFHFHSSILEPTCSTNDILEIIADFFASEYARQIPEWKICSRYHSKKLLRNLTQALDIAIEDVNLHREQELLCKGIFTELW
ncbi:MAG TPA: hypothetical protein VND99_02425 [Candidatus Acidoferrales bacterium]|nr:hypothetical protein [Candidatus Acidoferrales bacterium]